jgi:ATP-dependent exoDNAse (exonuclease V) alpha subunit
LKNAQEIEGETIQGVFFKKGLGILDVVERFKDIDYLIIDEVSQITSDIIIMLQELKQLTKTKFILVGDVNQCGSVDNDKSWMNANCFNNVIENNIVKLEYIDSGRYTKDFDKLLDKLIEANKKIHNKQKFNMLLSKMFKRNGIKKDKDKNNVYLVYSHKMGKLIEKERNIKYSTVHSKQGETINEPFSIYEWEKMPFNVLYTALSRGTKKEDVFLVY